MLSSCMRVVFLEPPRRLWKKRMALRDGVIVQHLSEALERHIATSCFMSGAMKHYAIPKRYDLINQPQVDLFPYRPQRGS